MEDTEETQGAVNTGPTFQDALTILDAALPKPKDGGGRNDFEIVTAAEREINRLREYAALPVAAETPESTPGWRELSYEEPPYGKDVLFRRDGGTPYVGQSVKPDPGDDPNDGHGLLISIDGDLYDGDPPNLWSEIPGYYYDDVAAIAATMDGDDDSNDDVDTAEESDDSEVFYRDIDDPPPIGVNVLLLYKGYPQPFIGSRIEGLKGFEGEDSVYVDDCGSSDPPIFWSYLPKLPDIDLENADGV